MKTIKSKHLYALLVLSAVMASCLKTGPDRGAAGERIIPRLTSSVLTKAGTAVPEQDTLFKYSDEDISVTLFEEDNLTGIGEVPTKGAVVTTSGLNADGKQFRMDAWLGSANRYDGTQDGDGLVYDTADKDNYHFISETVTYGSGSWSMGAEHIWRNSVPTSFWSLHPVSATGWTVTLPGDKAEDDDQKKLSFTYTIPTLTDGAGAAGQPDLCVAFSHWTWEDGSDNFVDIDFKHALSAVYFDITDIPEGLSVTKIAIKGLKGSGSCTVTGSTSGTSSAKGVTFGWTTSGGNRSWSQSFGDSDFETSGGRRVTKESGSKIFMLIPQTLTADTKLSVTFYDGTNSTTREASIGDGTTSFKAGKRYTFRLGVKDGVLTAGLPDPYNGDPLDGTDLGDDGLDPYSGDPLENDSDPAPVYGPFSVSATKKVYFSPGNLYWDGSEFKFEEHQYDYPTSWDASHIGHLYFYKTADVAISKDYSYPEEREDDVLFTNATGDPSTPNPAFTVNGETGKWMTLSLAEWNYLFYSRTDNYRNEATINSDAAGAYGMILYPDNYPAHETKTSYTCAEWTAMDAAGCVFLPGAGYRHDSVVIEFTGVFGDYWTSEAQSSSYGNDFWFYQFLIYTDMYNRRQGYSVRLVTEAK